MIWSYFFCSECECTSDGSTLDCDDTGDCICKLGFTGSKCDKCKEGFTGSKCDECQPKITGKKCNECKPNYFNYPLCQGMHKYIIVFLKSQSYIFFFLRMYM